MHLWISIDAFMDIQKYIYGYPIIRVQFLISKNEYWISKNEYWISKNDLWISINTIMDIEK